MTLANDQFFTLTIECGRHGGVFQRLAPGDHKLGSSADCDIVLSDPGIEAEHLKLRLGQHRVRERLTVQAMDGSVAVGSRTFSPGQEIVSALPVRLTVSGVEFCLRPSARGERRKALMEGMTASALAVAAFVVGLNLFSQQGDPVTDDAVAMRGTQEPDDRLFWAETARAIPPTVPSPIADLEPKLPARGSPNELAAESASEKPVPADLSPIATDRFAKMQEIVARTAQRSGGRLEIQPVAPEAYRLTGYLPTRVQLRDLVQGLKEEVSGLRRIETLVVTVDGAAEALRRRLMETGLDAWVQVSSDEGAVVATGEVKGDEAATWRAVLRWFDERFGRDLVLDGKVGVSDDPAAPPLSIRAVWTGTAPYIIAGNGRKYVEGTLLDSGWTIEQIEREFILLSRRGETLRLKL